MGEKMRYFSPILDDGGATKSDRFAMLSNVLYSDDEIIKVSQTGNADYWGGMYGLRESNANFFRCFLSCCAVMAA